MPSLEIEAVHLVKIGFYAVVRSTTLKGFVFFKGCALIEGQVHNQGFDFTTYFFAQFFIISAMQKRFGFALIKVAQRRVAILLAFSYQHIISTMKKAMDIASLEERVIEIASILAMGYLRYKKAQQSTFSVKLHLNFNQLFMKRKTMSNNILAQVAALSDKGANELKKLWRKLYQTEPPPFNKPYYIKRLAYRIQELALGIDNSKLEKRLAVLAGQGLDKPAKERKRLEVYRPVAGTRLMREWDNQEHHVTALEDGFEYRGMRYNSLSAVAKKITGTTWNGLVFFGLKRLGSVINE